MKSYEDDKEKRTPPRQIKHWGYDPQTSKSSFKVKAKVETRPYDDQMDHSRLSNWLRQLEDYFNSYRFTYAKNIYFSQLEMEVYASLLW
jgi:hypothetical protein